MAKRLHWELQSNRLMRLFEARKGNLMKAHTFDKKAFKKQVKDNVKTLYRKEFEEATQQEVYQAVALVVKDEVIDNWLATQKTMYKTNPKTVYYMSMEFLMGRALGNNMINLCNYNEIKECLE